MNVWGDAEVVGATKKAVVVICERGAARKDKRGALPAAKIRILAVPK